MLPPKQTQDVANSEPSKLPLIAGANTNGLPQAEAQQSPKNDPPPAKSTKEEGTNDNPKKPTEPLTNPDGKEAKPNDDAKQKPNVKAANESGVKGKLETDVKS